jgi:hypothetical protein
MGAFIVASGKAQAEQQPAGVSRYTSVPAASAPLAPTTQPPAVEAHVVERYLPKSPQSVAWGAETHPTTIRPGALSALPAPVLGWHVDSKPAPLASESAMKPSLKQTDTFAENNELRLPLTERQRSAPPKKPFAGNGTKAQRLPQTPLARGHTELVAVRGGALGDPVVVATPFVKALPAEMGLVYTAPLVATPPTAMTGPAEWVAPMLQSDAREIMVPKPAAPAVRPPAFTPPTVSVAPAAPSSAARSEPVGLMAYPQPSLGPAVESAAQTLLNTASAIVPGLAALTDSASSPEPSSAGPEVLSKDEPQPPASPTVPLDNGSFGLSPGGQTSSGGIGDPLLLLGVVVCGGFLLRRQEGLLSLVSWEIAKPDSVLLVPLERPG